MNNAGVSMDEALDLLKRVYRGQYGVARGYYDTADDPTEEQLKTFLDRAGVDTTLLEVEAWPVVLSPDQQQQAIAIERFEGYVHQYNGMLEEELDNDVLRSVETQAYNDLFYKLENTDSRDLISHELESFYEDAVDEYTGDEN